MPLRNTWARIAGGISADQGADPPDLRSGRPRQRRRTGRRMLDPPATAVSPRSVQARGTGDRTVDIALSHVKVRPHGCRHGPRTREGATARLSSLPHHTQMFCSPSVGGVTIFV